MFKLRNGFIVGGLVGAAAAMVLVRKRPETAARMSNAVSGMCSRVARWAVSGWVNHSWDKAAQKAPKPSGNTAASSKADLASLETLINSDPAIKQEVSRIEKEATSVH